MSSFSRLFGFSDIYDNPWYWGSPRRRHDNQDIAPLVLPHAYLQNRHRKRKSSLVDNNAASKEQLIGKNGFQLNIDVEHFKPNEITVKTVDNVIVIDGKHEEREDEHGLISRSFTRRYTLPKVYDPKTVTSSLSSDGILTINAPKPDAIASNERTIEIQHIGPARSALLTSKESETDAEKDKMETSFETQVEDKPDAEDTDKPESKPKRRRVK